ncbi:hypothetical protein HDU98_010974 [Podochytrium sp. JEL0797]|nr:hypothetical protein HDU98_010974 [Podochytrium sp. JEL0797]
MSDIDSDRLQPSHSNNEPTTLKRSVSAPHVRMPVDLDIYGAAQLTRLLLYNMSHIKITSNPSKRPLLQQLHIANLMTRVSPLIESQYKQLVEEGAKRMLAYRAFAAKPLVNLEEEQRETQDDMPLVQRRHRLINKRLSPISED